MEDPLQRGYTLLGERQTATGADDGLSPVPVSGIDIAAMRTPRVKPVPPPPCADRLGSTG